MTAHVSSQILGTLDPHQVSSVMNSARAPAGGYPVPGQQSPNVTSAMNKVCFVDDNTWRLIAGGIHPYAQNLKLNPPHHCA